jgi:hypothetical protein
MNIKIGILLLIIILEVALNILIWNKFHKVKLMKVILNIITM